MERDVWVNRQRSSSHPEHVVDEQPGQQQARHLQAGQPHEGDHGHAQAHGQRCGGERKTLLRSTTGAHRPSGSPRRTVHEEPVPGQNPDQHQHDGEGEGEQLGQGEASAAAEGNPAGRDVSVYKPSP